MKKPVRILALTTAVIFISTLAAPAFATDSSTAAGSNDKTAGIQAEKKVFNLSMDEAVKLGLQNSIILKQVQNQIDLAALTDERAKYNSDKLNDGNKAIKDGREQISQSQNLLNQAKKQLDDAYAAVNAGVAPMDIPGTSIKKGKTIDSATASLIKTNYLDPQKNTIADKQKMLDSANAQLKNGEISLDLALEQAGVTFSDKLGTDTTPTYSLDSSRDLMTTMAGVQYSVTKSSYDIYKNQLAMLIQKSYYDVLKAQKILDVKKKAMDRGEKQYQFAKDSYNNGMKAKDDMLLANTYYKGTQIEVQKAQGDLNNALIELKKNLNVPLDAEITLKDVLADAVEAQNLEDGLKNGLQNRLEIKKAAAQTVVYDINFDSVQKAYPEITFQYREAKLLQDKAHMEYNKTRVDVEASIRQSFETLQSTAQMMNTSKEMVEQAKESVDIAEYKYKEGFGSENSLLKKLDIGETSGTIVEVLAAEENMATVDEKVVEIEYGYNLAKMKYFNDIGKFVY